MSSNNAAWLMEKQGNPLQVKEAPYPSASGNEVVIQNKAVSVNPVDWKIQESGYFVDDFPAILGTDCAGEVVEVGPDVKTFNKGDRVLGHCPSLLTKKWSQSGFQQYTNIPETLVAKMPSSMSFEQATVLPLGVSTAAAGLYEKEYLGLQYPSADSPKSTGKAILVWGAASSVGSCAVQLAKHSGYEVFATASKHNHDYVQKLGASQVFDYREDDVVDKIVNALKGKSVAGIYDAISEEKTVKACCEIATNADIERKFIALTLPGADQHGSSDIAKKPVFALTLLHNEVGPAVWRDFLPQALEKGSFLAKPDPEVVGKGLEAVQSGLDKNKAGVSAVKVVITL